MSQILHAPIQASFSFGNAFMPLAPHGGSDLKLVPTGVAAIDAEHDAILDALTELIQRPQLGQDELSNARQLLSTHFQTEEATMGVLRSDRRQAHKDAHDHFLRTVDGLIDAVCRGEEAGGDRAYPLMLWFIVHSNTADAELAEAERQPHPVPTLIVMKDWLAAIGAGDLDDGDMPTLKPAMS